MSHSNIAKAQQELKKTGCLDIELDPALNLEEEINRLKKEKNQK